MIEKHFKKIIIFLIVFMIGYILHITRYETLESAEKSADYKLVTTPKKPRKIKASEIERMGFEDSAMVEKSEEKTEWVFQGWEYNTKSPLRNGYFVRDRWTNEIKWKDLK